MYVWFCVCFCLVPTRPCWVVLHFIFYVCGIGHMDQKATVAFVLSWSLPVIQDFS